MTTFKKASIYLLAASGVSAFSPFAVPCYERVGAVSAQKHCFSGCDVTPFTRISRCSNLGHCSSMSHSMSASAAMPDGEREREGNTSPPLSSGNEQFSNPTNPKTSAFGPRRPIVDTQTASSEPSTYNPDEMLSSSSQPLSPERQSRIDKEEEMNSRFLHGDELVELRLYIERLESDLTVAREKGEKSRMADLVKTIHDTQNMDAEYVYVSCMENAEQADKSGLEDKAAQWRKEAVEARSCLPQFNLEGLWVGKYGDHGYEMINVTYVDDALVATKVTGDQNVPKGEISFKADLHPDARGRKELQPIELSDVAAKQWGHKHLPRFPGSGQVAAEGFTDNQFVDGQLIIVGEYFSFAWIPIGHQIFFGRPSAELTLKMLKQSKMTEFGAADNGSPNVYAEMRAVAERCLEETDMLLHDEIDVDGELCFISDDKAYFSQDGCFE